MSSPGQVAGPTTQVAGATSQAAGQTAGTAKDEAKQVGQTAASAAADVAGTAKEQVGNVAGEAVTQVKDLADQAKAQLNEQAGNATQQLSKSLRSLVEELRGMTRQSSSGPAAEVVGQLADRGSQFADYLESRHPGAFVQDLRSFAARKPGAFLAGSLAAGVVTGRLVRGATASGSGSSSTPRIGTTARVAPLPAAVPPAGRYGEAGYDETGLTTAYPSGSPSYGGRTGEYGDAPAGTGLGRDELDPLTTLPPGPATGLR